MNVPAALVGGWASLALTITWQLAALAAVVWLCERVLKLRQPRARHALWWFVLLAPLALAPGRLALARKQAVVSVAPPRPVARIIAVAQLPRAPAAAPAPLPAELPAASVAADAPAASWWSRVQPIHAVALLWLLGAALLALRLAMGHCRVQRMLAQAQPVADPDLLAALVALSAEAGVRRQVQLRTSNRVAAPLLYGWRRPTILVPAEWLAALSPDDLRALLAHEIAHVRRRDFLANLVQRLTEALLFFHPATWLASRRISLAREELCDAWALRQGADAGAYARSLASAAERAHAGFAMASVGVAESRFTLLRRVEAIMRTDSLKKLSGPVVAVLAATVLLAAAVFAAVSIGDRPAAEADDAVPVTVMSGDVALTPQELGTILDSVGIKAERYTYSYPHPHELHITREVYVDGARTEHGMDESWLSMDPGENTLLLLVRREGDDLGFQFEHGGSSAGGSRAGILEGYDGGFTQGALRNVAFSEGESIPIYVFAANRPEAGGIRGFGSHDDLQKITSAYDMVIVIFAELWRTAVTQPEDEFVPPTGGSRGHASAASRAAHITEASEVLTNMKQVALAVHMWLVDNDGTLPPTTDITTMRKLLKDYVRTEQVFMRPGTDEVVVRFMFQPGTRVDAVPNPAQTPLAIADYHPDFRVVAYLDGHAKGEWRNDSSRAPTPVPSGGGGGGGGGG